jgi:hypothetical protein
MTLAEARRATLAILQTLTTGRSEAGRGRGVSGARGGGAALRAKEADPIRNTFGGRHLFCGHNKPGPEPNANADVAESGQRPTLPRARFNT